MATLTLDQLKNKQQAPAQKPGASSGGKVLSLKQVQDRGKSGFVETLKDIPSDIVGGFKTAGESFFRAGEDIVNTAQRDDRNFAEKAVMIGGRAFGGGAEGIGDLFLGGAKAFVSPSTEAKVGDTVEKTAAKIMQTQTAQDAIAWYNKQSDFDKDMIKAAGGFASALADLAGGGAGSKLARKGFGTAVDVGQKTAQVTKNVAGDAVNLGRKGFGKIQDIAPDTTALKVGAKNLGKEAGEGLASQASGFSPQTIRTIINDPQAFKAAKEAGLDRMTLANQVKDILDKRVDDLGDLGDVYKTIRESGQQVNVPASFIDDSLKRMGLLVKDGVITTPTTAKIRASAADLGAIQQLRNTWGPRLAEGPLGADEYFNFRTDLAEVAKFDKLGVSGKTAASQKLSAGIRADLNADEIRKQLPGLKELDARFAPEKKEVDRLIKEFFDKEGNLKDAAVNKIANAGGLGKDLQLARLKKLMPDIEPKIKLVQALKDVTDASGNRVGTYLRAGAVISTGIANPVAGAVVFLLTQPTMMIKYLSWIGNKSPGIKKLVSKITSKIKAGTKLNKNEEGFMSNLLKNINQQDFNAFLDSTLDTAGTALGVSATEGIKQEAQQQAGFGRPISNQ